MSLVSNSVYGFDYRWKLENAAIEFAVLFSPNNCRFGPAVVPWAFEDC